MRRFIFRIFCIVSVMVTFVFIPSCIGSEVTESINFDENKSRYRITRSGEYTLTGTLTDKTLEIDTKGEVRLILSGVTIDNSVDEAIEIENSKKTLFITDKGTENYISGNGDAAISAESSIEFCGEGALIVIGNEKHAIESDGDITINGGKYDILAYEHGMKSESVIKIMLGDISITSETGKGIKAEKEYIGEDGNIVIYTKLDEGLESKGALTINGGNYDITSYDDGINAGTSDSNKTESTTEGEMPSPETFGGEWNGKAPKGFGGKRPGRPDKSEEVTEENTEENGEIEKSDFKVPEGATVSGRGVPFEFEGRGNMPGRVNADSVITINGGTIRINTFGEGDGIDSNGSLSILGGNVIIDGPEKFDNGSLDSDGEMIIENATVLCASSNGMTQYPRSMTQKSILIDFETTLEKGTVITVNDSIGNTVIEHTVGVICDRFYFTSPDIKNDTTYTVYINGVTYSETTATTTTGRFGGMPELV